MPLVALDARRLRSLLGKEIATAELVRQLPEMGGDVDKVEGDAITMEWYPNRPDLLVQEGTARALRAFLGIRPGLPSYKMAKPTTRLEVDVSVAKVRPHAALAFVRGLKLTGADVASLVDAQEKLCLSMGRRRRKIAIGIHDAAGLNGPFRYTTIGGNEKAFVPLGMTKAMTPAAIVKDHPKGREYGHLVGDRFPVFLDGTGNVLSMPPIINAQATAVTTNTKDLLLDVTGTDARAVRHTIALLATCFAESGGSIEPVAVHDSSGTWTSPDLKPSEWTLHTDDLRELLGTDIDADKAAAALQRMGHEAQGFGNKVLVHAGAWRFDLLHPVDVMEDVAIGIGFSAIVPAQPTTLTYARTLASQPLEDRVRTVLLGLGWSEAKTLTLSNPRDEAALWNAPATKAATLLNPVLEEQTSLRTRIVPSLLRVLAQNRHRSLPQRLWEIGDIVEASAWKNRRHVAAVETGARTDFAAAKALAEAIVRDAGLDAQWVAGTEPGTIAGRCVRIRVGGKDIGWAGELHPDTVTGFGLGAATVALELRLP